MSFSPSRGVKGTLMDLIWSLNAIDNHHYFVLVATRGNETLRWTYAQYFDDIKRAARAFIKVV